MGYYASIILVGAFFIGGITIFAMKADTRDADLDLADHQLKVLSREAAHTGLQMTVRTLADSYNMNSWIYGTDYSLYSGENYKTGSYSVTVSTVNPSGFGALGDTVDVVSRGRNGNSRHVIFARYARDKDDVGIPPGFRNAITSDFYMQFMGNMLVASIDGNRNASIHTNQDLDLRGNSFRVEGYGTYSGSVNINPAAEDNFDPPNDYNGDDPNHFWAPEISIPMIDSVSLANKASSGQGLYWDTGVDGPLTIDGDVTPLLDFTDPASSTWSTIGGTVPYTCADCGTPEKPAVVYVDGPLEFLNRVEVNGNAIFLSNDEVRVTPNGNGGGFFGRLNSDQETEVLLASLGGVDIGFGGGNACLGLGPATLGSENKPNQSCKSGNNGADGYTHGVTVYALGRVEMQGTPIIVGGVVANETYMQNGGNPSIIYSSANEGTIDAGFEYIVPIGPILIAFSEF
ncbi:MAG: hypothetical protein HKN17_06935 [Rhodothermales bacterium]|nr:hypothetical protein [Rhodothermales bacterium]